MSKKMIYSNVKINKKRAEEISRIKDEQIDLDDEQINLDDEFIIGLSSKIEQEEEEREDKEETTYKKKKANSKVTNKNKAIKKQDNKKKKIKKKKNINFTKFKRVAIVLLFLAGVIGIMISPLFRVKEISVSIENKKILTEDEIKTLSEIKEGDNLFFFGKNHSSELIKSNQYVDSVKIERAIPNKIKVTVVERSVQFQLESNGKFINMDGQGYLLDESTERGDVVLITGYSTEELVKGNRLNEEDLKKLSGVLQIIQEAKKNELDADISKIDISENDDYKVYFDNQGKTAHIGNISYINDKLSYVKKILEMEQDYEGEIFVNVDFNSGEYPYFREKV